MNLPRFFLTGLLASAPFVAVADSPAFLSWADRPVMGWNSWDFYGTSINETKAKAQADYMAANLLPHGWNVFTVDIQWYEPNATGFNYNANATLVMDQWGRLTPATNRFPSAANGVGFKALADYVHAKGMKFGIHMMRGIPRQAWQQSLPIKGTNYTAKDIADVTSTCSWNSDMYGVDMSKPGAQEYFDSIMELVASWGVDFVKIDDLSRPYHLAEIEGYRKAIDKTGRPIIFSTSPGATPVDQGPHVMNHANQWRVSDDFWDSWTPLYEQFQRLHDWTPYRGPGHFPDADMLPIGKLEAGNTTSTGRVTNFTTNEQSTLMSLWAIARSPLILGGDMLQMDAFTLSLLTNDEVLAVNQHSTHNRQLFRNGNLIAWVADVENSTDKYLAVFNTGSATANVPVTLSTLGFTGSAQIRSLWNQADLGSVSGTFSPSIGSHAGALYRLSGNVLPTPWITDASGSDAKVNLTWEALPSATSYRVKRATTETGPFTVVGDSVTGTSYTDAPLQNGTTFYYVVSAIVSGSETPDSGARAVTPMGLPQVVGWNFDRYGTVSGAAIAGVVPAASWNNSTTSSALSNLIDSGGSATTLDISCSSYNTWSIQGSSPALDGNGTSNKRLLNGYLNAGPATWNPSPSTSSVTLSQIPHSRYDLVVYFSSDVAGRAGQAINGATSYYFSAIGPPSISGSNAVLTPTTQTTSAAYPTANYAIFRSLTGTTQTVTVKMRDNDQWAGIAAFQVIPKAEPENGMWSYWRFDESTGSTAVDAWGDRHGTLVGGASFQAGTLSNSLRLNAASQGYLALPADVVATLGDFTVSTWVKLVSVPDNQRIFDFGTSAGNAMFLTPRAAATGLPRFAITTNNGVTQQMVDSALPISSGAWHHVAVTLSGGIGRLYIDGILAGANSTMTLTPASLGSTTANYLGRSQNASDPYLDGSLDDFRIYNRALSSAEISALPAAVAAPQNVTTTAGPLNISLAWDSVAGATYTVRASSGGAYTTIVSGLASPAFIQSGLTFGTNYSYIVTAETAFGSSFGSTETTATPLSPLISDAEAQAPILALVDETSGTITTTAATVAGHAYQLQARIDLSGGTWSNVGPAVAGTGQPISFSITRDSAARQQFYRIVVTR